MKTDPELFDHLAEAHRTDAQAQPSDAPFGFATRGVAKWQELRRNEIFRAWERLSIRTAIGASACAVVFGLFTVIEDANDSADELVVPPPQAETPIPD